MAFTRVLHCDERKHIAVLFPDWDETLDRERRAEEEEELRNYEEIKQLELEGYDDDHVEIYEGFHIFEQNQIYRYLCTRRAHFMNQCLKDMTERHAAFSMVYDNRLGLKSPLFQLDKLIMGKIANLAFGSAVITPLALHSDNEQVTAAAAPAALRKKKHSSIKC